MNAIFYRRRHRRYVWGWVVAAVPILQRLFCWPINGALFYWKGGVVVIACRHNPKTMITSPVAVYWQSQFVAAMDELSVFLRNLWLIYFGWLPFVHFFHGTYMPWFMQNLTENKAIWFIINRYLLQMVFDKYIPLTTVARQRRHEQRGMTTKASLSWPWPYEISTHFILYC